MKTFKAILLAASVLAGVVASTAPIFAASAHPTHPTTENVLIKHPAPSPIPVHPNEVCSAGGC